MSARSTISTTESVEPLDSSYVNRSTFTSNALSSTSNLQSAIVKDGVTYAVRYIGCLEVKTSMKSLDFEKRSQVAKECIRRVCEAAGLKTSGGRSCRGSNTISRLLGDRPRMEHAGADVSLTVSSGCLVLGKLHTGEVIVRHDMPRISFASGGDTDTLDFVAYVAKNLQEWRACYVLECGGGLAQEVISTIGQAFELRFKQFLTKPPNIALALSIVRGRTDRDYYNDLPGKVPPEMEPPPVPPLPNSVPLQSSTPNLIDLHSVPTSIPPRPEHNYVNDSVMDTVYTERNSLSRDVFDMQPFTTTKGFSEEGCSDPQKVQLWKESWFHGAISRSEAESLLKRDGDFLVRESQGAAGQYVLTGMQQNTKKHLLLIDPEGVVRTKDRNFENVSHLINYHCKNQLPIISAESALVLRTPVPRSSTSINPHLMG